MEPPTPSPPWTLDPARLLPPLPTARPALPKRLPSERDPNFRAGYEPLLKHNDALRRVFHEWRAGYAPDDEAWMRVLWPALFPVTSLSLTDGHLVSHANTLDTVAKTLAWLRAGPDGDLPFGVYRHDFPLWVPAAPRPPAYVVFSLDAAALVLEILLDDIKPLVEAAWRYHRVRKSRPEQRRRPRSLPSFDADALRASGEAHLHALADPRAPKPDSPMWTILCLVEAMLACPPQVRRVWLANGSREAGPHVWGEAYRGDLLAQFKVVARDRLVMGGHSRHRLVVGTEPSLASYAEEWRLLVRDYRDGAGAFSVEPMVLTGLLHMMAWEVEWLDLAMADETQTFFRDVANWTLVRLAGCSRPGRFCVDPWERVRLERLARILIRRRLPAKPPRVRRHEPSSKRGRRAEGVSEWWFRITEQLAEVLSGGHDSPALDRAAAAWTFDARQGPSDPVGAVLRATAEADEQDRGGGKAMREALGSKGDAAFAAGATWEQVPDDTTVGDYLPSDSVGEEHDAPDDGADDGDDDGDDLRLVVLREILRDPPSDLAAPLRECGDDMTSLSSKVQARLQAEVLARVRARARRRSES